MPSTPLEVTLCLINKGNVFYSHTCPLRRNVASRKQDLSAPKGDQLDKNKCLIFNDYKIKLVP